MALAMATISGKIVRPDQSKSGMTVTIHALTDGWTLTYAGKVIAGKIHVPIRSDGTARVSLPKTGQAGLNPSGALWRMIRKDAYGTTVTDFELTADTTWDGIIPVELGEITPTVLSQAQAARDAAVAAAASVAASTWQASTSVVAGQIKQAPDGSFIQSKATRTTGSSFDATEQTFWTVVAAVSGSLDYTANLAAAWARAPHVNDLSFPIIVAHRGLADLEAEDTTRAFRRAVGLGHVAVEAGDVQALSDGTLVCIHDSTVDRVMTGTGAVNSFTKATWQAMSVDYAAMWGGAYTNEPAPLWDDALAALAGRCIIVPEVKDQLDSTATAMCDRLDALGMTNCTIIQSFQPTNLAIASARGYKTLYLGSTATGMLGALGTARSSGVWAVGLDYTQADVTAANVARIQGAGFRVFLYTPVHQKDIDACLATGCDGIFSNEPASWGQRTYAYRKTQTAFHLSGRWEPGMLALGDSSGLPDATTGRRGTLIGPGPGGYRVALNPGGTQRGIILGTICPIANASGTYTLKVGHVVDTLPTTTSQGPGVYFAMPDDSTTNGGAGSDMANSYFLKLRANGGVSLFEISATGSATSLGSSTCTAMQTLTTTASASGTVSTLSVSALTVALKVGHQFMLPNGQVVTINAAASIGATSVTIVSTTLTSTIASGSVLKPYVIAAITVTPTGLTAWRDDESSVAAITSADTAHRGGYVASSSTAFTSPGAVSVHKATVS